MAMCLTLATITTCHAADEFKRVAYDDADVQRLMPPPLIPRPESPGQNPLFCLSLDGGWQFNPNPPADFWTIAGSDPQSWKTIRVPGEWALQGFTVKPNDYAAYRHTFQLPANWASRRTVLRFDAVHSACRLYINGKFAGEYIGAFLPFEFDITGLLVADRNRLDLAGCNESIADELVKGNHYAQHPIGGILRKVQLVSVPPLHVANPFFPRPPVRSPALSTAFTRKAIS